MDAADPIAALVQGNSEFALDLYAQLSQGDGNRFLSPFSISTALAMTYAGAQEETAVQIARALHFTLPPVTAPPGVPPPDHRAAQPKRRRGRVRSARRRPAPHGQRPLELRPASASSPTSRSGSRSTTRAGCTRSTFATQPEQARRTINAWVEEQTKGKIQDLLKPTHIDPHTVLVLTNAIYFKALWASPFSKEKTAPDDFHASSADRVRVDMMNQAGRFRYFEEGAFKPSSCRTRATRWRW